MMDRFRPEELRVARLSRGLNLREAAELTGLTKETLSFLERGKRFPHAHTLKKIADAYGVPVEHFLYTREEVATPPKAEAPPSSPETEEERRAAEDEERLEDLDALELHDLVELYRSLMKRREEVAQAIFRKGPFSWAELSAEQRQQRDEEFMRAIEDIFKDVSEVLGVSAAQQTYRRFLGQILGGEGYAETERDRIAKEN